MASHHVEAKGFLKDKVRGVFGALGLMCLALLGAVGCAPPPDPLPNVSQAEREAAVKAQSEFAVEMYRQLKTAAAKDNLFFSPYSISSAFTMLYAGARNETAKQLKAALRLGLEDQRVHPANAWLMIDLNNRGRRGAFQLSTANRLWGQKGYAFSQGFLDILDESYRAGLAELPFATDAEGSRKTINDWVAEQTQQRIKDLMPQGSVLPTTLLVLTNAVYFKAAWKTQFDPKETRDQDFFVSPEKTVKTPMMRLADTPVAYHEGDKVRVVSLAYKGNELSFVVVLPNQQGYSLEALENDLSAEAITGWLQKSSEQKLSVGLPKLKLEQRFDLIDPMKGLGVKDVFDDAKSDLSGIDDGKSKLFVQAAVHKSFLEVNEEGTEAAAATGISVGVTSAPPNDFVADRPFLFLIRDNTTGNILFLGRIKDPSQKE